MKAVFADTFYWVALTNPADPYYRLVLARAQEIARMKIVTSDAVLTEVLTFFSADPHLRERAGRTARAMLEAPDVQIIPDTRDTFLAGLQLYCDRPDKQYSMTDCISMAQMRRAGLTDVLTNDRHFEQEGFRALFR